MNTPSIQETNTLINTILTDFMTANAPATVPPPPVPSTAVEDAQLNDIFGPEPNEETAANQTPPPIVPPNSQAGTDITPAPYEGFKPIALRCVERGQRPFPISTGSKKPCIKEFQNLAQPTPEWVEEMAARFTDAAVGVVAKPDEFLFIDEDESQEFRSGYEAWSGLKYPETYTTESRPNHRQSHWLQTDATRKMGNISQRLLGILSVRQKNLYVLAEGSPHPSGTFYRTVDSSPAIRIPDVLVAYILYLKSKHKPEKSEPAEPNAVTPAPAPVTATPEPTPESFEPEPRLDDGLVFDEGGRNDAVSRFVYHEWVMRKHDEDTTRENAHAYNESHCQPPLGPGELEDVINGKLGLEQIGTGVEWNHESNETEVEDSTLSFQDQIIQLQKDGKTDQIQELWNKMMMENQAATASAEKAQSEDVKNNWWSQFRSVAEMEQGEIVMVIDGVLQEGTCFLGAVPGDCKTLVALSMAKAISTGQPLFGQSQFRVKQARSVIYLIPEVRDRAFRKRCENFQLPHDKTKFMCRTISMGLPLDLQDPYLLEACRQLHPVVFLDTAIRFSKSDNQNDAAKNQMLVNDVVALLAAGAVTVVLLHHATKASKKERMDLQNMLSGTGDFGAMCDQAYGLQVDAKLYDFKKGPLEVVMVNLKDREEQGTLSQIRLAASRKVEGAMMPVSYINEKGDFHVVDNAVEFQNAVQKLLSLVKTYPDSTLAELSDDTGLSQVTIRRTLNGYGWHTVAGGKTGSSPWHQDGDKPCSYLKPEAKTVKDAVMFLRTVLLAEMPEADILTQGDKVGLTDALLAKARKRLGVRVEDGVWALPGPEATSESQEPVEPDKGGRPTMGEQAMTPAERQRVRRARRQPEQVN